MILYYILTLRRLQQDLTLLSRKYNRDNIVMLLLLYLLLSFQCCAVHAKAEEKRFQLDAY